MLDLARIEAGKVDLEEESFRSTSLIHSVDQHSPSDCRKEVWSKSIAATIRAVDTLVHVDPIKIKQVLLNLLSNAVKFTQPRGRVIVGCGLDSHGDLVISVSDTGIGIPRRPSATGARTV